MKISTTSFALILLSSFQDSTTVESFSTTASVREYKAVAAAERQICLMHPKDSFAFVSPSRLFSSVGEQQQQQQRGPPPSGPPGGGRGGPPPQTKAQKILEQCLDVIFKILYLGDEIGLQDSSKNLRVLWTRTILDRLGKIDDPIAYQLLPKKTRWVASLAAKFLPQSVIGKLDWIVQRTAFIDRQLQSFLQDTDEGARRQVLVLGSGYDTRCLRYGNLPELGFYCVDLPAVSSNCGKIVDRYRKDVDGTTPNAPTFVPLDLNDVGSTGTSLLETLSCSGFVTDGSVPTMVLCEAVLFYLKPESAQSITGELFSLPQSRYCLTDNLSKVGVIPGGGPEGPPPVAARSRCEAWLKNNDKDLVDHDSIWGGAIHFVGARESSK